jgi:thiol-disulfide isomerase/thioredoxin
MQWEHEFEQALPYGEFLERHGSESARGRWQAIYDRIALSAPQRTLLEGFARQMHLLCVAGTWCGDCVRDCPILQRFAEATPKVTVKFADRDTYPDLREAVSINKGYRIPIVLFLSEDYYECARYGERTVATYRKMAVERLGPACPTGIVPPGEDYLGAITQEWLNEVERVQLMLRLSPRLRERHGD